MRLGYTLPEKLTGTFNFRAGVVAAIVAGACAATVAAIGAAIFYEGGTYVQSAVWPVLGCTTIFACAAGAAYVRRPRRRFVGSLIIVALVSMIAWAVISSSPAMPTRHKGDHPLLYSAEILVVVTPPIITALLLTLLPFPSKRKEAPIVA